MVDEHPEAATAARVRTSRDDGGQIVDAAEVLDDDALDAQVVAPDLLDEFGVVAALHVDPAGQRRTGPRLRHRDRTGGGTRRRGPRGLQWRRDQDHRAAVEQEAGAQGKAPGTAVPILQVHPAVLDAHDGAHPSALGILDHQTGFRGDLGGPRFVGAVRVSGQHIGAVAIVHPAILETP